MKEDLSLYGNELNYANAVWSAAYVFGQIPSNLLLTRVSIRGGQVFAAEEMD
jgi:ACS family pantothenate transporter-like MFS transporter